MLRAILIAAIISLSPARYALAADGQIDAKLYKNPQCFCCDGHAEYLRQNGFSVTETVSHDLSLLRRMAGVPEPLEGCHITFIDGYIVEGHMPIGPIRKLLSERPAIKGISLPGMPDGSPGMTGEKTEPFTIYEIAPGAPKVFAVE